MVPTQISCRVLFFSIGFFPAGFFWPPSDSAIFVNCRSACFIFCIARLVVIIGRYVTFCHSSRCSAETTKINLMVLFTLFCV